jgi:ABC-2 family transporter protein
MNFLPVAIRELQVTARRTMTYYWRSLNALNAACITLACLLLGFGGALSASSAGHMTFQLLSDIGYGIAAGSAALMTADCISEERRDGTLGFLFLTDLKGFDIIMGKLARLGVPVYCLIATFPALGFTMLLGGVSIGDFARVAVTLVNALFFFSALGLLVSAWSWSGRVAVSMAMACVVVFSAPMAGAMLGLNLSGLGMALLLPTPGGAFLAALYSTSKLVSKPNFLASLAVSHALGWLFLILASRIVVRNFSREEPKPAARSKSVAGPNPALALYSKSTEQKPYRLVFLLAALVASILVVAEWISPTNWYDIPTFGCVVLGLHLILKYWTAHSACRSLPSRRHSGELEILLTTPLDGDAILLGSTTAIKRQLLWPFLFVVAMDGLMLLLGWRKLGLWVGFGFAAAMLLEFIWFIGNLYSLTWVGLCMGLKCSSHAKALGRTLFYILLLPWSVLALAAAVVGVATMGRNLSPAMGAVTVAEFLVALTVCNLGFTGWAVSELRDRFRLLAASQTLPPERFVPSWRPILRRLHLWLWKREARTV